MPFTFKLSRRLAGLPVIVAAATLLATACELQRHLTSVHPVARVELSPPAVSVPSNQPSEFSAVAFDTEADSAIVDMQWRTTGGTITDMGVSGRRHLGRYVSGTCGTFTVIATSQPGGKADSAAVTVTCPIPVASVDVSPPLASIDMNQTVQLSAIPKDANGGLLTGRAVGWASSNTAVATVNGTGLVAGKAAGSATITATSEGRSGTSDVTVTMVAVASVTVSPASANVEEGRTLQLTATPRNVSGAPLAGRAVSWASSNTAAATVSGTGLVTGNAAGSATITATSEGQSGASAVTVQPAPPPGSCLTSATTWQNTSFTAQTGSFTVQFDATPNASLMDGGTGLSQGSAAGYAGLAVIVRFNASGTIDARNGSAYAAVNAIPYTSGTNYRLRLVVDIPTHTYSAYVTPFGGIEAAIGTGFTFRTEQQAVTSLANWALFGGIGTHTVCNFTLSSSTPPVPVAAVEITPAAASVDENKTVQLTATPKDASGTPLVGRFVTWASGNASVATVSASGLVTGNGAGTVAITGTSEGQSGKATITVVHVPAASVTVAPSSATIQAGSTAQLTATPKDASGSPLSGRTTTWLSGNTATATVNGAGLVSGVAEGVVTITATSEGQTGSSAITVTAPPPPGSGVVFVGAGDIAGCSQSNDEATAKLLDGIPGTVFTAGDNVYPNGTDAEFAQCYDPTWGRHKARTRPSPGNHDYNTSNATGYYNYFGANAGPAGRGYYSYDLGDWHIISLNSNITMSAGSTQEQWLRADLAANPQKCVLAYWHHPRFSAGSHGSSTASQPLWQALYDFNAEIVVVGHDHNYQRFAPQTPAGQADPVRGIRQFLAGMGGQSHYSFSTPIANTEAYNTDTDGVLKLTLYADSYTWEFIPVAGKTYTDSGSASCH